MKKFNKLVCVGILGLTGLFSCSVFGASAGFNTPETTNLTTNWTRVGNVLFFNNFTENTSGEIFAGSTTVSGGTSTITFGLVETTPYAGTKLITLYGTPTQTNGSITFSFYGWAGTTTVLALRGTQSAMILNNPVTLTFTGGVGTSSSVSITSNPSLMAVSVNVTSGTVTADVGMTNITAR